MCRFRVDSSSECSEESGPSSMPPTVDAPADCCAHSGPTCGHNRSALATRSALNKLFQHTNTQVRKVSLQDDARVNHHPWLHFDPPAGSPRHGADSLDAGSITSGSHSAREVGSNLYTSLKNVRCSVVNSSLSVCSRAEACERREADLGRRVAARRIAAFMAAEPVGGALVPRNKDEEAAELAAAVDRYVTLVRAGADDEAVPWEPRAPTDAAAAAIVDVLRGVELLGHACGSWNLETVLGLAATEKLARSQPGTVAEFQAAVCSRWLRVESTRHSMTARLAKLSRAADEVVREPSPQRCCALLAYVATTSRSAKVNWSLEPAISTLPYVTGHHQKTTPAEPGRIRLSSTFESKIRIGGGMGWVTVDGQPQDIKLQLRGVDDAQTGDTAVIELVGHRVTKKPDARKRGDGWRTPERGSHIPPTCDPPRRGADIESTAEGIEAGGPLPPDSSRAVTISSSPSTSQTQQSNLSATDASLPASKGSIPLARAASSGGGDGSPSATDDDLRNPFARHLCSTSDVRRLLALAFFRTSSGASKWVEPSSSGSKWWEVELAAAELALLRSDDFEPLDDTPVAVESAASGSGGAGGEAGDAKPIDDDAEQQTLLRRVLDCAADLCDGGQKEAVWLWGALAQLAQLGFCRPSVYARLRRVIFAKVTHVAAVARECIAHPDQCNPKADVLPVLPANTSVAAKLRRGLLVGYFMPLLPALHPARQLSGRIKTLHRAADREAQRGVGVARPLSESSITLADEADQTLWIFQRRRQGALPHDNVVVSPTDELIRRYAEEKDTIVVVEVAPDAPRVVAHKPPSRRTRRGDSDRARPKRIRLPLGRIVGLFKANDFLDGRRALLCSENQDFRIEFDPRVAEEVSEICAETPPVPSQPQRFPDVVDGVVHATPLPDFMDVLPIAVQREVDRRIAAGNDLRLTRGDDGKLRGLPVFTIDPPSSRDLDDAVSIQRLSGGLVELGVHIADASFFVTDGSHLDAAAKRRAESLYMQGRALPMLPRELSEDLVSLLPGRTRLAVSVLWRCRTDTFGSPIDEDTPCRIELTVVRSMARLSYAQAQSVINGTVPLKLRVAPPYTKRRLAEDISLMHSLCMRMRYSKSLPLLGDRASLRQSGGDGLRLTVDESGAPVALGTSPAGEAPDAGAHRLIEETALAANGFVARELSRAPYARVRDLTLLRIQAPPNEENLARLKAVCRQRSLPCETHSQLALSETLIRAELELGPHAQRVLGMIMKSNRAELGVVGKLRADTSVGDGDDPTAYELQVHYSLNKSPYTWFTSPMRRYCDIVAHRHVKELLRLRQCSAAGTDEANPAAMDPDELARQVDLARSLQRISGNVRWFVRKEQDLALATVLLRQEREGTLCPTKGVICGINANSISVLLPDLGGAQLKLNRSSLSVDGRGVRFIYNAQFDVLFVRFPGRDRNLGPFRLFDTILVHPHAKLEFGSPTEVELRWSANDAELVWSEADQVFYKPEADGGVLDGEESGTGPDDDGIVWG